jgi:hypothetical protein
MRADLHIHTIHSGDADQTFTQVLERAVEMGLGAVAISDHNSIRGSREAMEIESDVIVVPAIEITSSEGHILAYDIMENIDRDLSVYETVRRIHDLGGIAVAPHPYRIWSGLGEKAVREADFDAIETINGRSLEGANRRAVQLAKSLGLAMTGGSDAHDQEEMGKAYTIVPDGCKCSGDVVQAIIEGRSEAGGMGRTRGASLSYGKKCIGQWLGRGMRRL